MIHRGSAGETWPAPMIDLEALIDPDVLTAPRCVESIPSRWQKDCCQRRFPYEEPSMMEECHDVAGVSRED